ncbi:hypothetical protein [Zobellia russellii]|uniref:hypothetical protein n=1 Tax=Zobellia russellii TaxID=248907 RepID=UPI0037DD8A7C
MNLFNTELKELSLSEKMIVEGGQLSVNQERVIAFACFGLFGLAVYELSRNQCN